MHQKFYFELLCIFLYTTISTTYQEDIKANSTLNNEKLRLMYFWEQFDFLYPTEAARQQAIESGEYVPGGELLGDIDISHGKEDSRLFVTFPRIGKGTPATLGYILSSSIKNKKDIPVVIPYPNLEFNKVGNCNSLISVYRVKIDECGRLWVLDSGKIGEQICPPKIVMFDLNSDQSSTYEFPEDQYNPESTFVNLAVDVRQNCLDTFVYIADPTGCQLIIYDHTNKNSWNIKHDVFSYDPNYISFTLAGYTFDQKDGILGLALSPMRKNNDRILYFHSLSSVTEHFVETSVLRKQSNFESYDNDSILKLFSSMKKKRSSQTGVEVIDRNGVLFSTAVTTAKINCWNTNDGLFEENILDNLAVVSAEDPGLPSALNLKMINLPNGRDELWTNLVFFFVNDKNETGMYFKVYAGYTDELVEGTKCAPAFISKL
ncbi:protein yellow-like [Chelonus insularis]|uniref:protein yellow-like n=1 Tax=Chelonus insularis TaxID=460826 RepID=UPI0015891BD8|nr:protein yellow-like [Chelonus insularis]